MESQAFVPVQSLNSSEEMTTVAYSVLKILDRKNGFERRFATYTSTKHCI